jgi:hypothetical protein
MIDSDCKILRDGQRKFNLVSIGIGVIFIASVMTIPDHFAWDLNPERYRGDRGSAEMAGLISTQAFPVLNF